MRIHYLIPSDDYIFNSTNKTVEFLGDAPKELSNILVISNVTKGIIIYNFGCEGFTGSLESNVLTLVYDTSTMDDTDVLKIIVDKEEQTKVIDNTTILEQLLDEQRVTNAYLAMYFNSEIKPEYLK